MTTIKYIRPSGTAIEVNDTPETRALAVSLGWVLEKGKAFEQPKKGRK